MYLYLCLHKNSSALLKFKATNMYEAKLILADLVADSDDWDMEEDSYNCG